MNTYKQDSKIPIYIILQYSYHLLRFPINPEEIKKETASESNTVEIEGLGEVSQPKKPSLSRITIESFFWQQVNLVPSAFYVMWLEKWQKTRKPANLIVTRLNYSMQVTCERFDHWVKAGEEEDIYFSLELKEYKSHGAKKLKKNMNPGLLQTLQNVKDLLTPPILVDIPRPSRRKSSNKDFTNPYVCGVNETLSTISRKITGDSQNWKELYEANKAMLGDMFAEEGQINEGTKLTLPDSWVNNAAYNIVSENV